LDGRDYAISWERRGNFFEKRESNSCGKSRCGRWGILETITHEKGAHKI